MAIPSLMTAIGAVTPRLRRGGRWHRDGAVFVLCMTGCAHRLRLSRQRRPLLSLADLD